MNREMMIRVASEYYTKKLTGFGAIKKARVEEEREVRVVLEDLPEEVERDAEEVLIEQAKLDEWGEGYCRVRRETPGKCWLTKKDFTTHEEDSFEISEKLFEKIFKIGYSAQEKTRKRWKGWDIDILEDGTVVAEYELPKGEDEVEVPKMFKVKEVKEHTQLVDDFLKKA